MDGVHDLGGVQGFGTVEVEADEPAFHHPWERTARSLVYAVMIQTPNPSTSKFRHAIERMDPGHYLTSSYYEHWITAAASLAVESGLLTRADLEDRAGGRFPLARPPVDAVGGPSAGSRFAPGDRVRVRDLHFSGHTRCPRYVRGRQGVVVSVDGLSVLPDVEAHTEERPQEQTYTVHFDGTELWGPEAQPGTSVRIGVWDSYLERAE